ncbi:MAG: hypothetical protein D6743_10125 [Calditrichaeota bacterium]|nr:MAG: hypothetical protein D6743_10125 [Calditrichota bacterium]
MLSFTHNRRRTIGTRGTARLGRGVICVALLFGGLLPGCGTKSGEKMLKDMVRLDRTYIPALAATQRQDTSASKKTMRRLVERWLAFKRKYMDANQKDVQWRKDFEEIERRVAKANSLIVGKGDLTTAHETLEGIRQIFSQLRHRNHIDYFLDYLTAFHEPMEAVVRMVKDKVATQLASEDLQSMQERLATAKEHWSRARAADFDASLFGFDAERVEQMQQLMAREDAALATLQKALTAGQPAEIISAAKAIKPPFAKLFMLFGDFPARD